MIYREDMLLMIHKEIGGYLHDDILTSHGSMRSQNYWVITYNGGRPPSGNDRIDGLFLLLRKKFGDNLESHKIDLSNPMFIEEMRDIIDKLLIGVDGSTNLS